MEFAGNPAWSTNTLNLPLSLNPLTFTPTSQLFLVHVAGDGGSSSAFAGMGIQNLIAGSGPIRQELFADSGTTGGTILFANTSRINLGSSEQFRPVNVTALGGSALGAIGGHIVFQDASSSGRSTFNALRAEGASVLGASGGELIFRNNAVTTSTSAITVTGGTALGAAGGQASFQDAVQVEGNVNILAGTGGGLGGRATFRGNAVAGFSVGLYNDGQPRPSAAQKRRPASTTTRVLRARHRTGREPARATAAGALSFTTGRTSTAAAPTPISAACRSTTPAPLPPVPAVGAWCFATTRSSSARD